VEIGILMAFCFWVTDIDDLDLNGYSKTNLRSISRLLLYKRGKDQMTKGKDDDGSNGSPCHGSKDWTKAAMLRSSSNGWSSLFGDEIRRVMRS
jgi:hypothetical protein